MMPSSGESFQDKLQQLRQEYTDLLPKKLKEIDLAWDRVCEKDGAAQEVKQLRTLVHTLAGSGATFGYAELSACASDLEDDMDRLSTGCAFESIRDSISKRISTLHETTKHQSKNTEPQISSAEQAVSDELVLGRIIYWLGEDEHLALGVTQQLCRFNYETPVFTEEGQIYRACGTIKPDVVIFDIGEAGSFFPNLEGVLSHFVAEQVPVLCICSEDEGESGCLRVIRAGAAACITRPVCLFSLLEKLDPLTYHMKALPYKLFIVDDDVTLARNIASILTKAGMQVKVETNPTLAPNALKSFAPDLILTDLYMPECSGLELSRMIRQEQRYLTVPIVYLSVETEINKRLAALEAGADDFIFKPVKFRFLYHALSSRIKRARQLRNFYERDVLTGFLNHTCLQEELRKKLWHCIETNERLVVALIDIDRFKNINDNHGHAIGDQVMQTLAIKLKRHFGSQAILARYGGPCFALLFSSAGADETLAALEEVREDFSKVEHVAKGRSFKVSFSCGLACYPAFSHASDILEACQNALQKAKSLGRNRVVPLAEMPVHKGGAQPGLLLPEMEDQPLIFLDEEDPELYMQDADEDGVDEVYDGEVYDDEVYDDEVYDVEVSGTSDMDISDAVANTDETIDIAQSPAKNTKKVAIVDDDSHLVKVVAAFLNDQGYEVFPADTGDICFDLVLKHRPNLVIIDLLLFPGIHGFELCKKIKSRPELRDIRIILITAVYKDYRYQVEGKEAGSDAFLIKPINLSELLATIKRLIG